jgi:hypothetical protein
MPASIVDDFWLHQQRIPLGLSRQTPPLLLLLAVSNFLSTLLFCYEFPGFLVVFVGKTKLSSSLQNPMAVVSTLNLNAITWSLQSASHVSPFFNPVTGLAFLHVDKSAQMHPGPFRHSSWRMTLSFLYWMDHSWVYPFHFSSTRLVLENPS